MSWPAVALQDVCTFENGDRGKNYPSKSALVDEGIPFINAGNLQEGSISTEGLSYITQDHFDRLSNGKFERGDFLFCLRGTLGKFAVVDRSIHGAIASSLIIIRPNSRLHPAFLKCYLGSDQCAAQVNLFKNGAAQPNLAAASLKQFQIPLPPLEEQKRIAGILDQADALRRLRTRALDKLGTLGQAIFHEMFGDLISNEGGFQVAKIADVIEGFDTGKSLAEDPDAKRLEGFRVLKISSVTSGRFKPEEAKPLPVSYIPPKEHIVQEGDLLFSRANTSQLIGATAFVDIAASNLVLPDKLWRFVWKANSPVLPVFIKALFSSAPFRREIGKRASGTSGSMKNIAKAKVMSIPFGLPERSTQRAFSERLATVEIQTQIEAKQSLMNESLFASLQHRAFRGEL